MDPRHKRILNDLEWLLSSPPLIASSAEQFDFSSIEKQNILNSVAQGDTYPGGIPVRLGRHFENLFEIALKNAFPEAEVIRGLKIFEEKRTIGEIDFILKQKNLPTVQIEIAVKFYLQLPQTGALSDFVGPNKHDSLYAKLQKLKQQKQISGIHIDKRFFFLKGFLFYPLDQLENSTLNYSELNPLHNRSFWVERNNLNQLMKYYPQVQYLLSLDKNEWITPTLFLKKEHALISNENFIEIEILKPQYVALLDSGKKELARGFVLPEGWSLEKSYLIRN